MNKNREVESIAEISQRPDLLDANPQEVQRLMAKLRSGGELTQQEHATLEVLLSAAAEREPALLAQIAYKESSYSGPLPHFEQLNGYDEQTRQTIVKMAADEQAHHHKMQNKGLSGAIWKDRIGQVCAVAIALGGFAAAADIAHYSPAAAAIIGSFDILALVCAFIAPRVLEMMVEKKAAPMPPKKRQPPKKR